MTHTGGNKVLFTGLCCMESVETRGVVSGAKWWGLMCAAGQLTVNNKKYLNVEYWGKIPGIFKLFYRYSNMENNQIYKLFPAYSVPEKWSEYLKISNTFLAQNRFHFPGCLFFLGTNFPWVSPPLARCMHHVRCHAPDVAWCDTMQCMDGIPLHVCAWHPIACVCMASHCALVPLCIGPVVHWSHYALVLLCIGPVC